MVYVRTFSNGSEAYVSVVRDVLKLGEQVSPRGLPCRELTDALIHVEHAEQAVPVETTRKISRKIGATEYVQLLAGLSSLSSLNEASGGRFDAYADEGRLCGAYGPRVYRQLPPLAALLERDEHTRQAVVVLWDPDGEQPEFDRRSRDVPCTLNLQFRIRRNALDLTVTMRSSDVWLGIPYDWWQFSRLQLTLADALGKAAGAFTFAAGSLHLYEPDFEKADTLDGALSADGQPPALVALESECTTASRRMWRSQQLAGRVLFGLPVDRTDNVAGRWYQRLVPMVPIENGVCWNCRYTDVKMTRIGRCERCDGEGDSGKQTVVG